MKKIVFLASAILLVSSFSQIAGAQEATVDACRTRLTQEFATVRDEYRAHVFGSKKDTQGKFTVLSGGNTKSGVTGILETKGRLTSELVQPLTQSYRTLRCNMLEVCRAVSDSIYTKAANLQIEVLGCEPVTIPRYSECSLVTTNGVSDSYDAAITIQSECDALLQDTLTAERAALKTAVAYDSGYRSLLQYSGMMDWMQDHLSEQALRPLRDMINLLGKLHQIPCFIGQCDNPNPPAK